MEYCKVSLFFSIWEYRDSFYLFHNSLMYPPLFQACRQPAPASIRPTAQLVLMLILFVAYSILSPRIAARSATFYLLRLHNLIIINTKSYNAQAPTMIFHTSPHFANCAMTTNRTSITVTLLMFFIALLKTVCQNKAKGSGLSPLPQLSAKT